jgi:hypothetical protein
MWKEVIVAKFNAISWRDWVKPERNSGQSGVAAEDQTTHLQNISVALKLEPLSSVLNIPVPFPQTERCRKLRANQVPL